MGKGPKLLSFKSNLKLIYSAWTKLSGVTKIFSILASIAATGALYNLGFYRKIGLSGEAIVDPSSLSQGALFASLSGGFLLIVLRFHFVASSYAFENILAINPRRSRAEWQRMIADYDGMLSNLPLLGLPSVVQATERRRLRATRKKLVRQKWFFSTLQIVVWIAFFTSFAGFAAYLMRPFLSIEATASLFIKVILAYTFVVFSITVLSFKGEKISRWGRRFATLFFRPYLWLMIRGGLVGACYLYATLMSGIGEARYSTLASLPDVCVATEEQILKGKLITKNANSYIFASVSYPTFPRLIADTGNAIIPLDKVAFMTSGLPCAT